MKVNVLLRICDQHENNPDLKRIIKTTRQDLISRCLNSLLVSINDYYGCYNYDINLHIIDSTSDTYREHVLLDLVSNYNKYNHINVITREDKGNNESMLFCYEYAKENFENSLIYFVEDDNLHYKDSIFEMLENYELFRQNLDIKTHVMIHPCDSPLEYYPNSIYPSRIVLGTNRHWRTSVSCPFTMLIDYNTFKYHYNKFLDYSKFDGVNYHEANTINTMFIDNVVLFTPIPTLVYHIGYIDPPAPFCKENFLKLWEDNRIGL